MHGAKVMRIGWLAATKSLALGIGRLDPSDLDCWRPLDARDRPGVHGGGGGLLGLGGAVTYLRLAGFPRHGLDPLDGFVRAIPAAILPPIITRCPLPPHSLHSIPAFIPVPWQRSHGTGSFSCVGGLIDMVAHGLPLLMFGMPRRSLGTHTQHRPNIGSGRGNPSHWATVGDFCAGRHPWPAMNRGL
jgi:hypothetical protein